MAITYLALVDDIVKKYPYGKEIKPTFLNELLIRNVLFGEPLVIHFGHILNNPSNLKAFLEPETSPLRYLIERDFVKILLPLDTIEDSAEHLAESGIQSYRTLVDQDNWKSDIRPKLENISNILKTASKERISKMPPYNTSNGFQRLIKKTCENYEGFEKLEFRYTTEEDLNEIYRAYQKFDDIKEFPGRQEWEIAAIKYLNEQYINVGKEIDRDKKLLELMHFATAAHHYNMAACISKTQGAECGLETAYTRVFNEFHPEDSVTQNVLDVKPEKFKILELPEHLINTNCEIWGNLIDGALPNSNILKEKSDFLNALQQVTNGGADSQKDVRDAARAYSSKLAEIINPKARFHGNNVKVFASTVLVIASAYTSVATTNPLIGIIAAFVVFGGGFFGDTLVNPINKLFLRRHIEELQKQITTSKNYKNFFHNRLLDKEKADEWVKGLAKYE